MLRDQTHARLRLVLVTDAAALAEHKQAWEELLTRSSNNQPTLSPLWLLAWWRTFEGRGRQRLSAVLMMDGDRLVALAPLLRRVHWYRRALPFRRLELLASGEPEEDEIASDYLGIIAERGYEEAAAEALVAGVAAGLTGSFDELVLTALDGEAPGTSAIRGALTRHGLDVSRREIASAPYIRLPASWDAYLKALPGSGRYLIKRSLRDFEAWAGSDTQVERVTSRDHLLKGKRVLIQLHEQRWRAAGRQGVFASQLFNRFHDEVLPALLDRGALDLRWLTARGEPVAVSYSLIWNNRVQFYQGGRTMDVPKGVRPGIVLHAHAIRDAIAAGREEYDFLGGAARYKMQLATASRPIVELRATGWPLRELARLALERGLTWTRELRRAVRSPAAGAEPKPAAEGDKD